MPDDVCVCGHDRAAHAHYRPGTECIVCPPGVCDRFRSANAGARLMRRLFGGAPRRAESAGPQMRRRSERRVVRRKLDPPDNVEEAN